MRKMEWNDVVLLAIAAQKCKLVYCCVNGEEREVKIGRGKREEIWGCSELAVWRVPRAYGTEKWALRSCGGKYYLTMEWLPKPGYCWDEEKIYELEYEGGE